jgi:uncharacterized Zn finger protein (UPF0148 family)
MVGVAEADCGMCHWLGYRMCDRCGTPVFDPVEGAAVDLCGYCDTPEILAEME